MTTEGAEFTELGLWDEKGVGAGGKYCCVYGDYEDDEKNEDYEYLLARMDYLTYLLIRLGIRGSGCLILITRTINQP